MRPIGAHEAGERTMPSRREHFRKQPINYLEIFESDSGKFVGTVVDFNVTGLKLHTSRPLEVGTTYRWKLALREPIRGEAQILFDVVCRWCKEYTGHLLAGTFASGMEFSCVSENDRELIETMLDSSWFRDWRQLPDYEEIRRESEFPEQ